MKILRNYSLKNYNTFNVDINCNYFVSLESMDDISELIDSRNMLNQDRFVLGGGSNVLFKNNYPGWILKNDIQGIDIVRKEGDDIYIEAKGGEKWHELVRYCIKNNLGGLENLSYIPGTVGAAPIQNIGAYGVELKNIFVSLSAIDLETNELVEFKKNDCQFGYRDSIFKNKYKGKYLISSVVVKASSKHNPIIDYPDIKRKLEDRNVDSYSISLISDIIGEIRASKLPDPAVIGNCGSFFKNMTISTEKFNNLSKKYPDIPGYKQNNDFVKIPSGWLIEQCGWKGKGIGNASVYDKHSLIIVNLGGATGQELYDLSEKIITDVDKKFGILLEREVNILG